jgi:hypothetical protein
MKKLLVSEAIAIAIAMVIVIMGTILGWSHENIAVTFAATVATFTLAATVVVAFTAATLAATVVVAFVALAATFAVVAFAPAFIATVVAFVALAAAEDMKLKYRWVFLSLLGEGVIIWAILLYGPKILQ